MRELEDHVVAIQRNLDSNFSDYEILLVAQGPVHRQISDAQAASILANVPCVRFLQLALVVHPDVARSAIIENAIGDFVVLFDLAIDRLELIKEAVSICAADSDIIVGVSTAATSPFYRIARWVTVPLLAAIDYQLPVNATDFRCVSRRAINAVIDGGRFYHQLNMRLQKTGYPSESLFYRPKNDMPGPSLARGSRRFIRLLVFNSSRPLRWMAGVGLFGSFVALLFACYSLAVRFLKEGVVEGWTTTVLFMSIQFLLIFIILAFISEYLSRILDEQRGLTEYTVVFEKNSTTMINDRRVNVQAHS
jgi:hypothetical protein